MCPEMIARLIVLDLSEREESLLCTRHTGSLIEAEEFLVKWYPLKKAPNGFQSIADGLVFVPDEVDVEEEEEVAIQRSAGRYRYKDDADMLVLLLPAGKIPVWNKDRMPTAAKAFGERLALYWLRPSPGQLADLVWTLVPSRADAATIAADINTALEDETGEVPNYSVDNYARYDVALSYASEDRLHAEAIAKGLQAAKKRVFFDHDCRSRLLGRTLSAELETIYSKRATYCVLLVSARYKEKRWTREELRAALMGAALTQRSDYVIPVRLDATQLEELPEDTVYVPIERGYEAIIADILEKLAG